MAGHYTQKNPGLDLLVLPSDKPSAHDGQLASEALFTQFSLWEKLRGLPALDPRTH